MQLIYLPLHLSTLGYVIFTHGIAALVPPRMMNLSSTPHEVHLCGILVPQIRRLSSTSTQLRITDSTRYCFISFDYFALQEVLDLGNTDSKILIIVSIFFPALYWSETLQRCRNQLFGWSGRGYVFGNARPVLQSHSFVPLRDLRCSDTRLVTSTCHSTFSTHVHSPPVV